MKRHLLKTIMLTTSTKESEPRTCCITTVKILGKNCRAVAGYEWEPTRLPNHCSSGAQFITTDACSCSIEAFPSIQHDLIRDVTAQLLSHTMRNKRRVYSKSCRSGARIIHTKCLVLPSRVGSISNDHVQEARIIDHSKAFNLL